MAQPTGAKPRAEISALSRLVHSGIVRRAHENCFAGQDRAGERNDAPEAERLTRRRVDAQTTTPTCRKEDDQQAGSHEKRPVQKFVDETSQCFQPSP